MTGCDTGRQGQAGRHRTPERAREEKTVGVSACACMDVRIV